MHQTNQSTHKHLRRRLHAGHFAFMRAYVEGLDLNEAWSRYMNTEGPKMDPRIIAKLRDDFAAAAKRHDRHGVARLIRLDTSLINESDYEPTSTSSSQPSLEEFAFERGLEDFSYKEQIEAYTEAYGSPQRKESRRARMLARQLEALRWLESLAAEDPHPEDGVVSWLHPDLSKRLMASGIHTLNDLNLRISTSEKRWYAGIKGVGAGKAERIKRWLDDNAATLKFSGITSNIQPLNRLICPPELSGQYGRLRNELISAPNFINNDIDAAKDFINFVGASLSEHSKRAYLLECERILLWCIVNNNKSLSDLDSSDTAKYLSFLGSPTPTHIWIGSRRNSRSGNMWRPFSTNLGLSGRTRSMKVLRLFFEYLVTIRYWHTNPWIFPKLQKDHQKLAKPRESLDVKISRLSLDLLKSLPQTSANLRLYVGIWLCQISQQPITELVSAQLKDLRFDPSGKQWRYEKARRCGKTISCSLPSTFIDTCNAYLRSRGIKDGLSDERFQHAYLLGKSNDIKEVAPWSPHARRPVDPSEGLGRQTFYDQIVRFLKRL